VCLSVCLSVETRGSLNGFLLIFFLFESFTQICGHVTVLIETAQNWQTVTTRAKLPAKVFYNELCINTRKFAPFPLKSYYLRDKCLVFETLQTLHILYLKHFKYFISCIWNTSYLVFETHQKLYFLYLKHFKDCMSCIWNHSNTSFLVSETLKEHSISCIWNTSNTSFLEFETLQTLHILYLKHFKHFISCIWNTWNTAYLVFETLQIRHILYLKHFKHFISCIWNT
jgi:hypothetical protein